MPHFFSITIITLNEEKNIPNILQDLAHQTYKNFEVIVVDSNSTDYTQIEAEKFANNFSEFHFIKMENRGISLGRNTGGKQAKYNDLVFFDADTRIDPDFLERLSTHLEENPEIGAGVFKLSLKTEKLKYSIGNGLINMGNALTNAVYPTCIGACLYSKKNVFEAVGGFDETISLGEDSAFSVSIHKQGHNFDIIPVPFYFNTRRFEQDGTLKTLTTYLKSGYYLFIKKQKENNLEYKFDHYNEKK